MEQLLKELSMFNNYFTGFIVITRRKLTPKFTMPDIKFHVTENAHHHVRTSLVL